VRQSSVEPFVTPGLGTWSEWMPFPDPRTGGILHAPFGPGCYDLRLANSGQKVLCGKGNNVAYRMTSLLPAPLGCGTRKNKDKRDFVLEHLSSIEYRTIALAPSKEAKEVEDELRASGGYLFPT